MSMLAENVGALNDDVKSFRRDVAGQVALEVVDRLFPMAGELAGGFFTLLMISTLPPAVAQRIVCFSSSCASLKR